MNDFESSGDGSKSGQNVQSLCAKLGHHLEEVRCRALRTVKTKLQLDLVSVGALEREPTLVPILVGWTCRQPLERPAEFMELVSLLASRSSSIARALLEAGFLETVTEIRKKTSTSRQLAAVLDKVAEVLPAAVGGNRADSTAADYEEDFESDDDDDAPLPERYFSEVVSSSRVDDTVPGDSATLQTSDATVGAAVAVGVEPVPQTSFLPLRLDLFPAVRLSKTDGHVFDSIRDSLRDGRDSRRIQQVCGFMSQVIFEDFPVEVFLQRPAVVQALFKFLWSPGPSDQAADPPTLAAVVNCLLTLCKKVAERCFWHSDPQCFASRLRDDVSSTASEASLGSRMSAVGRDGGAFSDDADGSASDDDDGGGGGEDDVAARPMGVREFCCVGLLRTLRAMRALALAYRVPAVFPLLPDLVNLAAAFCQLAGICLGDAVWAEDSDRAPAVRANLAAVFVATLDVVGEDFLRPAHVPAWNGEFRRAVRLAAVLASLGLVNAVVPPRAAADVLPPAFLHTLYGVVLDPFLWTFWPAVKFTAEALLEDEDGGEFFRDVRSVVASFDDLVVYFADEDVDDGRKLALAWRALPCLAATVFEPAAFVRDVVGRLSVACQLPRTNEDDDDVHARSSRIMHALLRHHRPEVTAAAYSELNDVLRFVDDRPKRLKFLFSSTVLKDVLEDGMCGPHAAVASRFVDRMLRSRRLFEKADWDEFVAALTPNLAVLQAHGGDGTVEAHMIAAVTLEESRADVLALDRAQDLLCCVRGLFSVDAALRGRGLSRLLWLLADEPDAHKKFSLAADPAAGPPVVTPDFLVVRPTELRRLAEDDDDGDGGEPSGPDVFGQLASCGTSRAALGVLLGQAALNIDRPGAAAAFLREPGLDWLLRTLRDCVSKLRDAWRPGTLEMIPSVAAILLRLCLRDGGVVRRICSDGEVVGNLIRAAAVTQESPSDRSLLAALVFYLAFHPVCGTSGGGSAISLPAVVGARYRVPFSWTPETVGNAGPRWTRALADDEEMGRVCDEFFRVCLVTSWERLGGRRSPPPGFGRLATPTDVTNLNMTDPRRYAARSLAAVRRGHEVERNCVRLRTVLALVGFYDASGLPKPEGGGGDGGSEPNPRLPAASEWIDVLQPHFFPTGNSREPRLGREFEAVVTVALDLTKAPLPSLRADVGRWLAGGCLTSGGRVLDALEQLGRGDVEKTELHRNLVRLVGDIRGAVADEPQLAALVVFKVLNTLHIRDATDFYSLSWLLECLRTVARLTGGGRGWVDACGLSDAGRSALLARSLTSVIEVVAAFQAGRGARADSFMGRGSTRLACFVLGNLAREVAATPDDQVLLSFFYQNQQQAGAGRDEPGLTWLVPLWTHRDVEIRAAGLDLVAKLTTSSKGCQLIAGNLTQIAGGLWGASLSFILDDREPSLTREKAALILVNLISNALAEKYLDGSLRLLLVKSGFLERMVGILAEFCPEPDPDVGARTTPSLLASVCRLLTLMLVFCPRETEDAFAKLGVVDGLRAVVQALAVSVADAAAAHPRASDPVASARCAAEVFRLLRRVLDRFPDEAAGFAKLVFPAVVRVFRKLRDVLRPPAPPVESCLAETLAAAADLVAGSANPLDDVLPAVSDGRTEVFGFVWEGVCGKLGTEANRTCLEFLEAFASRLRTAASGTAAVAVRDLLDDWEPTGFDGLPVADGLYERRLGYVLVHSLMKHHRYVGESNSALVSSALSSLFVVSASAQRFVLRRAVISGLNTDLDALSSRLTRADGGKAKSAAARLRPTLDLVAAACRRNADVRRQAVTAGLGVSFAKLWPFVTADLDLLVRYLNAVFSVAAGFEPDRHRPEWSCVCDRLSKHVLEALNGSSSESRKLAIAAMLNILTSCASDLNCRQQLARNRFAAGFASALTSPKTDVPKKNASYVSDEFVSLLARWTQFEDGVPAVANSEDCVSFLVRAAADGSSLTGGAAARVALLNLSAHVSAGRKMASRADFVRLLETALKGAGSEAGARWAATVILNLVRNDERSKALVRQNRLNFVALEKFETLKNSGSCDDLSVFTKVCDLLFHP